MFSTGKLKTHFFHSDHCYHKRMYTDIRLPCCYAVMETLLHEWADIITISLVTSSFFRMGPAIQPCLLMLWSLQVNIWLSDSSSPLPSTHMSIIKIFIFIDIFSCHALVRCTLLKCHIKFCVLSVSSVTRWLSLGESCLSISLSDALSLSPFFVVSPFPCLYNVPPTLSLARSILSDGLLEGAGSVIFFPGLCWKASGCCIDFQHTCSCLEVSRVWCRVWEHVSARMRELLYMFPSLLTLHPQLSTVLACSWVLDTISSRLYESQAQARRK